MRVFLTGNARIEHEGAVVGSDRLPGRQGRLLLACLVVEHERPVPRDELAELLWGDELPATWDKALAVLISKLRALLASTAPPGKSSPTPSAATSCNCPRAPGSTSRKHTASLPKLSAHVRQGRSLTREQQRSKPDASPASPSSLASRVSGSRRGVLSLRLALITSLDLLADVAITLGDGSGAVVAAAEACELEPFRETSHQRLMRAHVASGNRAEALRAFDRCRHLLVDELGVDPAPETQAVYLDILRTPVSEGGPLTGAPPEEAPSTSATRASAWSPRGYRIAMVAAALVAVVATLVLVLPDDPATAVPPGSLAALDPRTGDVRDVVPLAGLPGDVVSGAGSLWVAVPSDGTVSRVDPSTARVIKTVVVDPRLSHLATDGTQVWFSTTAGSVGRIDPQFDTVSHLAQVAPLDLSQSKSDRPLSTGLDALWLADPGGLVVRIDPRTGRTTPPVEVGAGVVALAVGPSGTWVANRWDGTVSHVDATQAVAATIPVGPGPRAVAVTPDAVWVVDDRDDRVLRIDPATNVVVATVPVPGAPRVLATGGGSLWVGGGDDDTLTRIDPRTDRVVRRVRLGSRPQGLVAAGGLLWVTTGPTHAAAVTARGGVLRMDVQDELTTLDPAFAEPGVAQQLAYATCGRLVVNAAEESREGFALVPDLAASVPVAEQGSRVFRFRVPAGRTFAPPSRETITAGTFQHVIERVMDPSTAAPGSSLLPRVVGLQDFQAHRSAHIAGLQVRGDTLTITLEEPSANLLPVLATTTFCAVPLGTPSRPLGVATVPSSGPYSVVEFVPGRRVLLRRNPAYTGPRPVTIDEIDVALGVSPEASLRRIESGATDYAAGGLPPARRASLAAKYGEGSPAAAAGKQRFFSSPANVLQYVGFNASRPLFSDPTVRRAVSFAVDRPALALQLQRFLAVGSRVGGPAYDGLLPAELPAVAARPVYPVSGPDLVSARRLMAGRRATAVLFSCTKSPCPELAAVLRTDLARIGITVEIRAFPKPVMFKKLGEANAGYDLTTFGWGGDYGAAETWLSPILGSEALTRFSDPVVDAGVRGLQALSGESHDRAAARFAHELSAARAPAVVFAQDRVQELFSARVGCQRFHPVYGMDLGSLCLR